MLKGTLMQNEKYFFFWKHRLSQWHIVDFTVDSYTYNCCEQYMMQRKALLMGDFEAAAEIMLEKNPANHQALGRKIQGFNQDLWNANKYQIVRDGNMARFTQSAKCRELLLATGDKILVEASPYDKVWGVGLADSDTDILDETKWKGENLLGKVLTEVREIIKSDILLPN
jgi:ribA/ribD-fused uncharacterized protein